MSGFCGLRVPITSQHPQVTTQIKAFAQPRCRLSNGFTNHLIHVILPSG